MNKACVLGIRRLNTLNGPGLRTLICFMGCPLKCRLCLNDKCHFEEYTYKNFTTEELFEEIKIDNLYFLATGGGITFGGGEPLLHTLFLKEFMEKYKEETCWSFGIETSLNIPRKNLEEVLPFIDFFIVDVKDMDKNRYEKYTEGNFDIFYENLLFLRDNFDVEKIKIRIPKIPDFHIENEQEENFEKIKELGFKDIELFDYIYPDNLK